MVFVYARLVQMWCFLYHSWKNLVFFIPQLGKLGVFLCQSCANVVDLFDRRKSSMAKLSPLTLFLTKLESRMDRKTFFAEEPSFRQIMFLQVLLTLFWIAFTPSTHPPIHPFIHPSIHPPIYTPTLYFNCFKQLFSYLYLWLSSYWFLYIFNYSVLQ